MWQKKIMVFWEPLWVFNIVCVRVCVFVCLCACVCVRVVSMKKVGYSTHALSGPLVVDRGTKKMTLNLKGHRLIS